MKLIFGKYGSTREAWLGLFLVCVCSTGVAQVSGDTGNTIASAPAVEEGVMYHVPLVPAELQVQDKQDHSTAPGAGLQGNFFQR